MALHCNPNGETMVSLKRSIFISICNRTFCNILFKTRNITLLNDIKHFTNQWRIQDFRKKGGAFIFLYNEKGGLPKTLVRLILNV